MEMGSFRSAVGWSFVLSGGRQAFSLIITVVLAALLGPTAYGTVAMAMVFVGFTQIFLVQGLMPALIQRRELSSKQLSSVFWVSLVLSALLAVVCILASGWWSSVNRLPDLQPVIIALSVLLPLSGLMVVQEAWLRRHMHFKELAIRENLSVVVGGVAGIVAAFLGAGVWALVVQQVVMQTVAVFVLWGVSEWRPKAHIDIAEVKELLPFTTASSVSAAGTFVNNQGDALIIGLFFGPAEVGLYRFASRMVTTAVQVLAQSFQAVSLPELARLQRDPEAVSKRLESLLSMAARTSIPLLAIMAAVSPWFIPILGNQWKPATSVLIILCAVGVMRVFVTFSGPLLQALNHPSLLAVLVWFGAILSAGVFVATGVFFQDASVSRQVNGMAVASLTIFTVLLGINSWLLKHFGGVGITAQFRAMRAPVFAGAAAFGLAVMIYVSGILDHVPDLIGLVVVGVLCTATAAGALLATDSFTREVLKSATGRVRRRVTQRGAQ